MRRLSPSRVRLVAIAGSLLLHGALLAVAWYAPVRKRGAPPPVLVFDLTPAAGAHGQAAAPPSAVAPTPSPRAAGPAAPGVPLVRRDATAAEPDAGAPSVAEPPDAGPGSPGAEAGSPGAEAGSPGAEAGSPGAEAGSPGAEAGSPGAEAGSPGAEAGSPGSVAGGPAHMPSRGTTGVPWRLEPFARPEAPTPEREHAEQLRHMVDEPYRERGRLVRLEKDLLDGRTTLAPMEQRMADWFAPSPAPLLARAGGTVPRPRRPIDPTDPSSLEVPRHASDLDEVVSMLRFGALPIELLESPTAARDLPAPPLYLVGKTTELLAELAALVQVDHDDEGEPASWRLVESSGDTGFDQEALAAVQDGIAHAGKLVLRGERKPAWSRWRFGAQLYWWRKDVDPSFHPPGVPVEGGGLIGDRTIIRETRLVALGFRAPAPVDKPAAMPAPPPPETPAATGAGH